MIDAQGTLKILDFGLARILLPLSKLIGRDEGSTATIDSDFAGTIVYISPEQLRSEPLDHRPDIFSLGVVLFEWATGLTCPGQVSSGSSSKRGSLWKIPAQSTPPSVNRRFRYGWKLIRSSKIWTATIMPGTSSSPVNER